MKIYSILYQISSNQDKSGLVLPINMLYQQAEQVHK